MKRTALFKLVKRTLATALCAAIIGTSFGAAPIKTHAAEATETIISENFDDGTYIGVPRGDVKFEVKDKALYVVERAADWNSYSYNLNEYQGRTIHFSGEMKIAAKDCKGIVQMEVSLNGETKYDWMWNAELTDNAFTKMKADYDIPAGASATLYFGTQGADGVQTLDSYFLDNISITADAAKEIAAPVVTVPARSAADVAIEEDFTGVTVDTKKGFNFGNPIFTIVDRASDNQALQVSDRTANYFGYAFDAAAFAGNKISLSAEISAVGAEKDAENTFNATIKYNDGADQYKQIATVATKGSDYIKMENAGYDVPADCTGYAIYFEGPADVSYIIDNIKINVVGDYVDPAAKNGAADDSIETAVLKDLYKDSFTMGVSCETISNFNNSLSEIGNPEKEELIKAQFNSITFGNELKPDYNMGFDSKDAKESYLPFVINPSAKEMLDWAKKNGIPVRGHTLVWHSQCPDAVFCKDYKPVKTDGATLDADCLVSREVMLERLYSYIDSLMKYMYENGYADVIYAWDAVNEAVEPGTNEYNLRESYWYKTIGADFVYYTFKYADDAIKKYSTEYASKYDIDAKDAAKLAAIQPKLFYNDYNEFQEVKCDAIIKLTTTDFAGHNLLKEGLIDGIGMQGHLSDNNDVDAYITALKRYSDAVGEVHITELDVNQTTTGVNAEYLQAKFYKKFFEALVQANKDGAKLTNVTIWGLTDENSWKKESKPLIFNGDLTKKLAFYGLVGAVTGTELPAPAYVAPDFKDMYVDFEKEDATPESEGFTPRGSANLSIQSDVVYEGKYALLDSGRTANWNGVSIDVSRFIGQTINVSGFVKTAAPEARLSADIDGLWPNLAVADTSDGEWKQLKATYKVPADMTSLKLYFEATTIDDIYVDNVTVKLKEMRESFEESVNIASARGVGHVPSFADVTDKESYKKTGHSFLVQRSEQDATMKFDVSKFIGFPVTVSAYVKTTDKKIRLGLDGAEPLQLKEVKAKDGWTKISATFPLSNELTSAAMYIETDGKADFYVDNIVLKIAPLTEKCEGSSTILTTRWGGAGTLEVVKDGKKNHAAVLKDRAETYYGTAFDVTPFLGMEVLISMDVKTDDKEIYVTGEIADLYPRYITVKATPGKYKKISKRVKLPSDISALKIYVESNGKSDLYVDNLTITKARKIY